MGQVKKSTEPTAVPPEWMSVVRHKFNPLPSQGAHLLRLRAARPEEAVAPGGRAAGIRRGYGTQQPDSLGRVSFWPERSA